MVHVSCLLLSPFFGSIRSELFENDFLVFMFETCTGIRHMYIRAMPAVPTLKTGYCLKFLLK